MNDNKIILNCFDNILISFSEHENDKCCRQCILKRFINTRKDRVSIKNATLKNIEKNFEPVVENVIDLLRKDDHLTDEYNRRKVYILNKNTLSLSWEYVSAVPVCDVCGDLPDDTAILADKIGKEVVTSIENENKMPFREYSSVKLSRKIEEIALSKNFGSITALLDNYDSPFPIAVAMLPLENGKDEPGTGRTASIEKSRAIALLEAYERYAGFLPRSKKVSVYNTYEELLKKGENVIGLKRMVLNEDSLCNNSEFANKKFYFKKNQPYHWVYGYNLTKEKNILVPETMAYYGTILKGGEYHKEIFAYEISNGCSVGGNITEAVYNGLLEVIERDAFLTAWYMDRSINRIIIDDEFMSSDNEFKRELEIFENFYSDYQLDVYEISCEVSIPVILMTVTKKIICENKMNFMCAAAADEDIFIAAQKALHEISSIFVGLQKRFEEEYDKIKIKADDLSLVENMDDHSLVGGYYKFLPNIMFDKQVTENICISDWKKEHSECDSLNSSLRKIVDELKKCGKEIIFTDQTTEEMKTIKMNCAKVWVTDTLPMTFGAFNSRISDKRKKEIEKIENRSISIRFTPHPFP